MRTSKSIFQFLKAFEDKASEGKTAIKLPDQKALKNDNAMVTVKTFRKDLRKFFFQVRKPRLKYSKTNNYQNNNINISPNSNLCNNKVRLLHMQKFRGKRYRGNF